MSNDANLGNCLKGIGWVIGGVVFILILTSGAGAAYIIFAGIVIIVGIIWWYIDESEKKAKEEAEYKKRQEERKRKEEEAARKRREEEAARKRREEERKRKEAERKRLQQIAKSSQLLSSKYKPIERYVIKIEPLINEYFNITNKTNQISDLETIKNYVAEIKSKMPAISSLTNYSDLTVKDKITASNIVNKYQKIINRTNSLSDLVEKRLLELRRLKKFYKVLKKAQSIRISDLASLLEYPDTTLLLQWLLDLPDDYNVIIDGDVVRFKFGNISTEVDNSIDKLINEFQKWEKSGEGKI